MKALTIDYVLEGVTGVNIANSVRILPQQEFATTASNIVVLDLKEPPIPESFFRALEDINLGRVVDADEAHSEKPPFRLED